MEFAESQGGPGTSGLMTMRTDIVGLLCCFYMNSLFLRTCVLFCIDNVLVSAQKLDKWTINQKVANLKPGLCNMRDELATQRLLVKALNTSMFQMCGMFLCCLRQQSNIITISDGPIMSYYIHWGWVGMSVGLRWNNVTVACFHVLQVHTHIGLMEWKVNRKLKN